MTTAASASALVARSASSCWSIVLDPEQATAAVPGLYLGPPAVDGLRRAALGEWFGSVRLLDVDEDDREVSYEVRARHADTGRHASMVIRLRLSDTRNGSRFDLELSGNAPTAIGGVSCHAHSLSAAIAQALDSAPIAERSPLKQSDNWLRWGWLVFMGMAAAACVYWRKKSGAR